MTPRTEASADPERFDGLVPTGAADAGPQDRARIAAVGLVEALAEVEARIQDDCIARARDHLTEVRAVQGTVLAAAVDDLTAEGVDVPPAGAGD